MKLKRIAVLVLVSCGVALFGTGAPENSVLRFGLSSDPTTLNPFVSGGTSSRTVKLTIYEGLVSYTVEGDVQPQLAESWEITDDAQTYVFHLRRGVKFHDGDEFTSADVAYTLYQIMDPKTGALLQSTFASVLEGIETPDDHTVVLHLAKPFAPFLEVLAQPEASIVSKEWCEAGHDLRNEMNGTGPFRFESRLTGVKIRVVRNPAYYVSGIPRVDAIEFIVYSDDDARFFALQTGEIDIIEYVPWNYYDVAERDPNIILDTTAGAAFQVLIFNVSYGPFSDPRVRRAIGYAIDREEISAACFEGKLVPTYGGLIPEGHWAYNSDLAHYFRYDPDYAKQLLAEAGYPNGFSATLLATSAYKTHWCPAEIVQAQLAKVGIKVDVELVDWPTRVEARSKWNYQFASDGLAGNYSDPDFYYSYFYSKTSPYCRAPYFADDVVDRLLDEGRTTLDREKRKEIYHELEKRLLDLSPWIFIGFRQQAYAFRTNIKGFKQLPGFLTFYSGLNLKYVSKE